MGKLHPPATCITITYLSKDVKNVTNLLHSSILKFFHVFHVLHDH